MSKWTKQELKLLEEMNNADLRWDLKFSPIELDLKGRTIKHEDVCHDCSKEIEKKINKALSDIKIKKGF